MKPIDLQAIREREAKATKGPWAHESEELTPGKVEHWISVPDQSGLFLDKKQTNEKPWAEWTENHSSAHGTDGHDAEFIAHARADVPALLALVDTMRDALLAVEWEGVIACGPACPQCSAPRFAHNPWCSLDAALTAAGLPDQASRDEARRLIAGRSEPPASES